MQVSLEYCNSLSLLLLSTPSRQNPPPPTAAAADVVALLPADVLDQSTAGTCNESMRPPATSADDALARPYGRCNSAAVLSGNAAAAEGPPWRDEVFGGSSNGRWMQGTVAADAADDDAEQRLATIRCCDMAMSPTNIDVIQFCRRPRPQCTQL